VGGLTGAVASTARRYLRIAEPWDELMAKRIAKLLNRPAAPITANCYYSSARTVSGPSPVAALSLKALLPKLFTAPPPEVAHPAALFAIVD
jgi:hypothetical protein